MTQIQTNSQPNKPIVCLIDDDLMIRMLFSRVIERTGCVVITANGVAEAELLLAEQQVDVVLCDLHMPEAIDGEQLLVKLKKIYPTLPVCMMSGDLNVENQCDLKELGANAYLAKPFSTDTFKNLLNSLELQISAVA